VTSPDQLKWGSRITKRRTTKIPKFLQVKIDTFIMAVNYHLKFEAFVGLLKRNERISTVGYQEFYYEYIIPGREEKLL